MDRIYQEQGEKFKENEFKEFDDLFIKTYYSHTLGKRKPVLDGFVAILNENGLEAQETLFIDDSQMHADAASEIGIHGMHYVTTKKSFFYNDIREYIEKINNSLLHHPQLINSNFALATK